MSPREKNAVVDELFADFVGRLQAQAPASVSRTAQIIPFPRKETSAELCREMAFSVHVSDPEELAVLLERRGFADDQAEARRMIAVAKAIFQRD